MKNKSIFFLSLTLVLSCFFSTPASIAQDQKPEVKLSEGEMKELNAINALTDPAAKLKAVADFVQKYPKTPIRIQLADAHSERDCQNEGLRPGNNSG